MGMTRKRTARLFTCPYKPPYSPPHPLPPSPMASRPISTPTHLLLVTTLLVVSAATPCLAARAQERGRATLSVSPAYAYITRTTPYGSFRMSNTGTAGMELMVTAQYGVLEADSSGAVTNLTLGSAGQIGDLTARLTFFPERVILSPGESRVLRYMVEGADALPDGGHIALMHFTMVERAAVPQDAAPAMAAALTIRYSVVAPLTLLSHTSTPTLTAKALTASDSTLTVLLVNTSRHPFVGSVRVVDRGVTLGSVTAAVHTRTRIEVPLSSPLVDPMFSLQFSTDYPGADATTARVVTPPAPLAVSR